MTTAIPIQRPTSAAMSYELPWAALVTFTGGTGVLPHDYQGTFVRLGDRLIRLSDGTVHQLSRTSRTFNLLKELVPGRRRLHRWQIGHRAKVEVLKRHYNRRTDLGVAPWTTPDLWNHLRLQMPAGYNSWERFSLLLKQMRDDGLISLRLVPCGIRPSVPGHVITGRGLVYLIEAGVLKPR